MIYLVTGLPGNGKTLFTVARAPELLAHEGRQIYYSGITDLTLPWIPTDPDVWYNLPVGSAVVIDEAQKYFRPLPNGAERPHKITAMETHRHKGMDLWLITQHPNLLDPHVRRLVGKHIHVHRTFGLGFANVWEWEQAEDPNDWHNKKKANTYRFKFPKEAFHVYKSAELHTVKRRLPWKLIVLPLGLMGAAGLAFLGYSTLKGSAETKSKGGQTASAIAPSGSPQIAPVPVLQRLESTLPAVPGLPHTAPRYEALTPPKAVPVAQACMADHRYMPPKCWCVSQRGTRLDVSAQFCENFIAYGRPFYDHEGDSAGGESGAVRRMPPPMMPVETASASALPSSPPMPRPLTNF